MEFVLLRALGLPCIAARRFLTEHQVVVLSSFNGEFVRFCFGSDIADEHARLMTMEPWSRSLAIRMIRSMSPSPPLFFGVEGARAKLEFLFREHWKIPCTLEQLAADRCIWLMLPDIGTIDIMSVFHACNDQTFRRNIFYPGHPLLEAMERYLAAPYDPDRVIDVTNSPEVLRSIYNPLNL